MTAMSRQFPPPLPLRLAAWARERYPLTIIGVLAPAYLVALLYGRALTHPGAPRLGPRDLVAFLGVWAFFLMVRIADDHKDYERDRIEYPDRVLQRGVVTLDQLKVVAGAAWAIQLAVVLIVDSGVGRVGLWWLLTLVWAALAGKDFFLGARITQHPVLYPLLHLPLSALVCLWMTQLGAGARGLPPAAFAVGALGVVLAAVVDLVRKLLPDGRDGRSYAVALGVRRAGAAGLVAVTSLTVVLAALVRLASGAAAGAGAAASAAAALTVLAVAPVVALVRFAAVPATARARVARAGLAVLVPAQLAVSAAALLVGAGG